jgi:hypothetical protein
MIERRRRPASLTRRARARISDQARSSGIHVQAARGSGKSSFLATLALFDFLRGVPTVIFEVQGGMTEQFLWQYLHLPDEWKRELIDRIDYVDMSGRSGYVHGWPLLYKLEGDNPYQVAKRFINLIKRLDPDLAAAPILGANAMEYVGSYVGVALHSMGYQLTEALDLLSYPERWPDRLRQVPQEQPELKQVFGFFLDEYPKMSQQDRQSLIMTIRTKLTPFTLDPTLRAMFGASKPGVNGDDLVQKRKLVILDFQDITDDFEITFKMRWCFSYLWEYIKRRRFAREIPLSVILDEFNYLLSLRGGADDLLALDLDNFINKDMRYRNCWLTVAHQELFQIPERIRKTVLSLGTHLFGAASDRESAEAVAKNYFRYDPDQIKRWKEHKAVVSTGSVRTEDLANRQAITQNQHEIITLDREPIEYTVEEQRELNINRFLDLDKFQFLLSTSGAEGRLSRDLQRVSIRQLVSMLPPPDQRVVEENRQKLIRRCGVPVEKVQAEIQARVADSLPEPAPPRQSLPARSRFVKIPKSQA